MFLYIYFYLFSANPFVFQTTLHQNGSIVFGYKQVSGLDKGHTGTEVPESDSLGEGLIDFLSLPLNEKFVFIIIEFLSIPITCTV